MVEIILYAFGIMYTPGPVNLLSLNAGINNHMAKPVAFCLGVGAAMLVLFLLFGYTGSWLISPAWQLPASLLGCFYISYLAWKIGHSSPKGNSLSEAKTKVTSFGFKSGFLMQLLNPKAPVAILPIVTVQFPAAQISGLAITYWSVILAAMAFGAPGSYLLMGKRMRRYVSDYRYLRALNLGMALLLLYVAFEIAWAQLDILLA